MYVFHFVCLKTVEDFIWNILPHTHDFLMNEENIFRMGNEMWILCSHQDFIKIDWSSNNVGVELNIHTKNETFRLNFHMRN